MPDLRKDISDELKQEGLPELEKLERDTMSVPASYFAALETGLLQRVAEERKGKDKVIRMRVIRTVFAIAAVFSLVFAGTRLLRSSTTADANVQLAALSDAELDAVIDERLAALSFDDMHTYLTDNIYDLETAALFSTDYIDDEMIDEKMQSDVKEHISSDPEETVVQSPVLEDEVFDDMEIESNDIDGY
ncbi:MAG: hypothetical protein R2794_09160 [Chitinophagales bacterium]